MSVYKIFPLKDATIYSGKPTVNAGRDEVLEVSSINSSNAIGVTEGADDIRRTLIQFSDQDINTIYDLIGGNVLYETHLKLYLAYASALPQNYTIECYPVFEDWTMGTGKFSDSPNPKNGVCWYTVGAYNQSANWDNTQGTQAYLYTTGGGTWNNSYVSTQTFDYTADKDLDLDVTSITDGWITSSIGNYGFILRQSDSIELNPSSSIETKFFSMDTHTIYPPCLEMRWDESTYNTGSNTNGIINQDDFILLAENNVGDFKEGDTYRFRFKTRERFPARNFTTSSEYLNWKYLSLQSYWAIQDYQTKEMIVDFDDNFTKLSADTNGNYFTLYTSGLQPERSYKVLVKTILPSTSTVVIDNDIIIKVGR
jgi:hypothetical protein